MCQDMPTCGEFSGWPARALAALWAALFAWALSAQWEAVDPTVPCDDLSYCTAHADHTPPAEPGPPLVAAVTNAPPAG